MALSKEFDTITESTVDVILICINPNNYWNVTIIFRIPSQTQKQGLRESLINSRELLERNCNASG